LERFDSSTEYSTCAFALSSPLGLSFPRHLFYLFHIFQTDQSVVLKKSQSSHRLSCDHYSVAGLAQVLTAWCSSA
jgi:hypothetical protein